MSHWHPKPDDLTPYMLQVMEQSYTERERPKCSRDDFHDGFLAALRVMRSRSSFKADRWEQQAGD